MDFFVQPKQFDESMHRAPKGYDDHFPELLAHALHHLHCNLMDRNAIYECANSVNLYKDCLIVFQTEGGHVYPGTFRPGTVMMREDLRRDITKTYYYAKHYYGCFVFHKHNGHITSTPYSLDQLIRNLDFTWSLFDLDYEKYQWLTGEKPEADYELPYYGTEWFDFIHRYKSGFVDYRNWHHDGNAYRASFLKGKILFLITVIPHEDESDPRFGVSITMEDHRPRCGDNSLPTAINISNTLGPLDRFSITCHEALGGDMRFQKNWENLKLAD